MAGKWKTIKVDGKRYQVRDVDLDEEVVLDEKGERITEAKAQELAEQILQRAGRGRPSLSGGRTHSPHVSFRVPQRLAEKAEEVAQREGKSLSQLGREALEEYLEKVG